MLAVDDHVFVPVVARAKTRTGFAMENEHLFRVKDGNFVYGRIYADTARGRDVLEGREPRRHRKLIFA